MESHPSVLTLKKLPDLSVRPEGGFPGGVGELEAMLTSCPQDWLSLRSGVCLGLRPCQQGPQLCGSETHFSCGETRGNSCFGHSQCYGGAGLLECIQCACFSSPSLLTLLPPLSFFIPPFPLNFSFYIFISFQPSAYFLAWTAVLPLPVYAVSSLAFSPLFCSHVIIRSWFIFHLASLPAQLPFTAERFQLLWCFSETQR